MVNSKPRPQGELRRGWSTGACATAATKAAFAALVTGKFPDPVEILLPRGERASFSLAIQELGVDYARAGVIKDAGDDPDVTHGATIIAKVAFGGEGISFKAGPGVGTVTKPGLPVAPGEPAINPVPRLMMAGVIEEIAVQENTRKDVQIEISVPGGEELAVKTWNGRLGIVGGLSILGTTGIVHPFSCSAWIHSIYSGIDVARATGIGHIAGSTGSTSEEAVKKLYKLPLSALIDMGDFAGGMLKYLRHHPIPRVTVAGGFGKITKLAQGSLDLHSGRSQVDFDWLARLMPERVRDQTRKANTAQEVEELARSIGFDLTSRVAKAALGTVRQALKSAPVEADIVIVGRDGKIIGRA
ncbi:MAG TPA: cobalt-precorrin-5B (C(1))-methyltransferase [Aestuariivirgaceae bacterium]|nr:cobalt-precorrin-5B (C(1))-methyltransferase [Aestuariivirgaceae bacterium]